MAIYKIWYLQISKALPSKHNHIVNQKNAHENRDTEYRSWFWCIWLESYIFILSRSLSFYWSIWHLTPTITYISIRISIKSRKISIQTGIFATPWTLAFSLDAHLTWPYSSLGSSSYFSFSLNSALMTLGEHHPFFFLSPMELSWELFQSLPQTVLLYRYQFPKQMSPAW